LTTSRWWGIRWGAWLRKESRKRVYWGYFRESPLHRRMAVLALRALSAVESEPPVQQTHLPAKPTIYHFCQIAPCNDLFGDIRPHRSFIKKELLAMLKPSVYRQYQQLPPPEISVHMRKGDFKNGNPITANSYFISCIHFIREQAGKPLHVTVFTDGFAKEIKDVLALENVSLAEKKADILDILQMSKSRVIVLSQSSTFSYWAAFLSDAIVIKPQGDWQNNIRPKEVNQICFEGKVSFDQPETLKPLSFAIQQEKW
jgi:hypothetical protein